MNSARAEEIACESVPERKKYWIFEEVEVREHFSESILNKGMT